MEDRTKRIQRRFMVMVVNISVFRVLPTQWDGRMLYEHVMVKELKMNYLITKMENL